jgi:hypothetical protein
MQVRLEISGGQPVTGWMHAAGTGPLRFTSWLALLAVLERLVGTGGSPSPADSPDGQAATAEPARWTLAQQTAPSQDGQ